MNKAKHKSIPLALKNKKKHLNNKRPKLIRFYQKPNTVMMELWTLKTNLDNVLFQRILLSEQMKLIHSKKNLLEFKQISSISKLIMLKAQVFQKRLKLKLKSLLMKLIKSSTNLMKKEKIFMNSKNKNLSYTLKKISSQTVKQQLQSLLKSENSKLESLMLKKG